MLPSDKRHQRAEIKRLRDEFDASEAHQYQLRFQLRTAQDPLASKEKEFSALAHDYYRLTNCRRRRASDTKNEKL